MCEVRTVLRAPGPADVGSGLNAISEEQIVPVLCRASPSCSATIRDEKATKMFKA